MLTNHACFLLYLQAPSALALRLVGRRGRGHAGGAHLVRVVAVGREPAAGVAGGHPGGGQADAAGEVRGEEKGGRTRRRLGRASGQRAREGLAASAGPIGPPRHSSVRHPGRNDECAGAELEKKIFR